MVDFSSVYGGAEDDCRTGLDGGEEEGTSVRGREREAVIWTWGKRLSIWQLGVGEKRTGRKLKWVSELGM